MAMQVRVVCPEECVYEREAAFVDVPSTDGRFGILPRHASEICTIEPGYVRISDEHMGTIDHTIAVVDGYVQVADNQVIILTERAADMGKVDQEDVRAKLAGFEDQLRNMSEDDAHRAYLYNEIAWCKLLLAQ